MQYEKQKHKIHTEAFGSLRLFSACDVMWCDVMIVDEHELNEVREDSVKVASKKHESALISEQSKLIDLQTLLDSREEASHNLSSYKLVVDLIK